MIEYVDSVVISRGLSGEVDENGDEILDVIYEGKCLFEISNGAGFRYDGFQFEIEPMLFVPVNDIVFRTNDKVVVTTFNGKVMDFTVKYSEAIADKDFEEMNDTCIWLKDGTQG